MNDPDVHESIVLLVWAIALAAIVAGVFAGVLLPGGGTRGWHGRWLKLPAIRIARWRVWVIAGVLVAGVACGAIGEANVDGQHQDHGQGAVGRIVDLLHKGVRQITGEAEAKPADGLMTRLSRVAGLAAILLLAFEVIVKLFQEPVQRWRLSRQRGHVVVCGLGRIGEELCHACCRAGMQVTAIESDPNSPGIASAIEAGALVWVGDATRTRDLRLARAARATHVFIATGSDESNLEAAHDLLSVLLESGGDGGIAATLLSRQRKPPSIVVHLDRPSLESVVTHMTKPSSLERYANELKKMSPEKDRHRQRRDAAIDRSCKWLVDRGIDLRCFNVTDRVIQELFDNHILDRRPTRVQTDGCSGEQGAELAHFVIVGFGDVGQRLALCLAETAHFENLRRSRMTIVYAAHEKDAMQRFRSQHRRLFPPPPAGGKEPEAPKVMFEVAESHDHWGFGVEVRNGDAPDKHDRGVHFVCNGSYVRHEGGAASPSLVDGLVRLANAKHVRPMVFLCDADDDGNCAAALQLREELTLRLGTKAPRPEASRGSCRDHAITIFPFVPNRPMLAKLATPCDSRSVDLIPFGDAAIACTFAKLKADAELPLAKAIMADFHAGRPESCGTPPEWEALSAWERHANLAAARHVNAKLRVIGLKLVPVASGACGVHPSPDVLARLRNSDRDLLKQMEHNRWMAERLLRGWNFGERSSDDGADYKRRWAFVDWPNLVPQERQKDDRQIELLMRVFGASDAEQGSFIKYVNDLSRHFELKMVSAQPKSGRSRDGGSP